MDKKSAIVWLLRCLVLALILAISFGIAELFYDEELFRGTLFEPILTTLFYPALMFAVFFVCGFEGGGIPSEFACYVIGAFVETLIIWLIFKAIWRLIARYASRR